MIIRKDMDVILAGRLIKNAEFKRVGSKDTALTKLAVAYGDKDGDIMNVDVWFDDAIACSTFLKGERVIVAGKVKSNDYNGKTYYSVTADYTNKSYVMQVGDLADVPSSQESVGDGFGDINSDDIPF